MSQPIKRAIVSVTDKTGVVDFCRFLSTKGVEILSTGGTAKALRAENIPVIDVAEFTGSPEILDGRLKTLHPKIEGGILGIRSNATHQKEMAANDIRNIDLVVVNLYDFAGTIAKPHCTLDEAIENVDIGGPTMLRAAAKNWKDVTVVTDPKDYHTVMNEMREGGVVSDKTRFALALKVFRTTARYDGLVSQYLTEQVRETEGLFGPERVIVLEKLQELRYGENPHQAAAAYREVPVATNMLVSARQLHGKELSFNNFLDLEAALETVREFLDPACVIIKHTNPCGVAIGRDLLEAFMRSRASDPVSCFGGIVGLNREVDAKTASAISETFFECLIAPGYSDAALKILEAKKNIRLMELPDFERHGQAALDYKRIGGGVLIQQKDFAMTDLQSCPVPTKRKPTVEEYRELDFAWRVVKHIKSNAILFTKGCQTVGIGAGQMSRVDSVKLAVMKATGPLKGTVMASDAFFPFRDGLDEAAKHGITAVVQPGGSVRDEEVVAAADEKGIAMIFTGMRHFRH